MDVPHNVHELVLYVLGSVACLIMSYGVSVLKGMKTSVDKLNVKVAVMFERVGYHAEELRRLDRQKADRRGHA